MPYIKIVHIEGLQKYVLNVMRVVFYNMKQNSGDSASCVSAIQYLA